MRRRLAASTAALAFALVASGCGLGDADNDSESATASTSGTGSTSSDGDATPADDIDAAAQDAGIDPTSPPQPISTVTMPGRPLDGDPVDLTVDLFSLKRQGDLLVLTIGITPDADADSKSLAYLGWTGTTWSPQLVDTTNLKVHRVVEADGSKVSSSTGATSTQVGPGQTLYLYAVFAAPPQDVTTMTVKPADGAPAITGVKIL